MVLISGFCRVNPPGCLRSRQRTGRKAEPSSEVLQFTRSSTRSVAPGTTAGISAGLLPVPEDVQLLASMLGGRQHVQVALLLAEPAGVLAEEDRGRHPQDYPVGGAATTSISWSRVNTQRSKVRVRAHLSLNLRKHERKRVKTVLLCSSTRT